MAEPMGAEAGGGAPVVESAADLHANRPALSLPAQFFRAGASAIDALRLRAGTRVHHAAVPAAKIGYRADVDGLRAVAVLPVLLFHSSFSVFSGGYVGVDIFF